MSSEPIYDVFIICPPGAHDRARALRAGLIDLGLDVFFEAEDLLPGDVWDREVPAAQRRSQRTLLLIPEDQADDWFGQELVINAIQRADENPRSLIPIHLDDKQPEQIPHGIKRLVPIYWRSLEHVVAQLKRVIETRIATRAPAARRVIVSGSGAHLLFGGVFARYDRAEERGDNVEIVTLPIEPALTNRLRGAVDRWSPATVAFGSTVLHTHRPAPRFTHSPSGTSMRAELRIDTRGDHGLIQMTWANRLGETLTPNDQARYRSEHILLGSTTGFDAWREIPTDIGGIPTIGEHLARVPGTGRDRWRQLRLSLLEALIRVRCVDHIDHLRLTLEDGALVSIDFRGLRASIYANREPSVVEVSGKPILA